MTQENQNITIYEGESAVLRINLTNNAGNPASLTDANSIIWRVLTSANSETAIIEKTYPSGGITLADNDDTNDQIVITIDKADSVGLRGDYYHECRAVDVAGADHVPAAGSFSVNKSGTL